MKRLIGLLVAVTVVVTGAGVVPAAAAGGTSTQIHGTCTLFDSPTTTNMNAVYGFVITFTLGRVYGIYIVHGFEVSVSQLSAVHTDGVWKNRYRPMENLSYNYPYGRYVAVQEGHPVTQRFNIPIDAGDMAWPRNRCLVRHISGLLDNDAPG